MPTSVTFRSAVPEDVEQLIDLMVVSSWGGIRNAWDRARAPSETWRDRGRIEIDDRDSEIGFPRFVVAESGGRIAAMMLLNLVGDTVAIDARNAAPAEAGALRLIKLSDHSIFVREIATAPWARGRGLASELLALAERVAGTHRTPRVTLIVNDANLQAEKLYVKLGFRACAEEASLGHPRFPDGSRLVLMQKRVVNAASPTQTEAPTKKGAP
jgi:ribosomal protein S18 acetylase RimI-like enzyme